jgi:hypothetical protein
MPSEDVLETLCGAHRKPSRSGGHICEGEHVVYERVGGRIELTELIPEQSHLSFDSCATVVSDEGDHGVGDADPGEVPGAVDGVMPGLYQMGCVADVVEHARRRE